MTQFYKLLADDMWHNGFTYHEGLNVDHVPFDPSGECKPGGLYYTDLEHLARWYIARWPLIADVTVPADACVYAEPCGAKWKADKLVLSNIRPLRELLKTLDEDTLCQMLAVDGEMLEHVENQTEAMCRVAIHQTSWALTHVKNQTEPLCLIAVQKSGYALEFVNVQTEALCLVAVQQDGHALDFVDNQTEAICLAAVQKHGTALRSARIQTDAICLAAVQQDGLALCYVHKQTEAICRAAVAQNPQAASFYVKIYVDF